ncbi:MAG: ParA family protein, partial [Clostridium sp.]|nr:ParA family protein [Clostridium sp.]
SRTKLCKLLTEQVTNSFQEQIRIFNTKIPNTVKVGESIYYSMPIGQYSLKSSASIAYWQFAKELVANEN